MGALLDGFKDNLEKLPGNLLLAMFFLGTAHPIYESRQDGLCLKLLLAAAAKGSLPAQAVVPDVAAFYNETSMPLGAVSQVPRWLRAGTSDGSIKAKKSLCGLEPATVPDRIRCFRNSGGYGQPYYTETGASELHNLAAFGTCDEVKLFLGRSDEFDLEGRTDNGETALYLACARGSWDVASELLDYGASAAVRCTRYKISCIHWVFAFDDHVQLQAVARLAAHGADLNGTLANPVPLPHYPFVLPAGTALHWAVVTSSHSAVKALVENGAELTIRDGSDPYKRDNRLRPFSKYGGPDLTQYSVPDPGNQPRGLSALDYAAMEHDPFIFEFLVSLNDGNNNNDTEIASAIHSVDEEGVNVLHRLSSSPIRLTSTENSFSFLPFRGSRNYIHAQLNRTIKAITRLGGNLEGFTTPSSTDVYHCSRRTPLMIAVTANLPIVVEQLLATGASVHTEDDTGSTALYHLPTGSDEGPALEIARILISAGADVRHRDKHHGSPFPAAVSCSFTCLDVVELMLAHGADVTERYSGSGASVLVGLAKSFLPSLNEDFDKQVSTLLERFVFSPSDHYPERASFVLGAEEADGRTILHHYADHGMWHSVTTLLQHGASLNSAQSCFEKTSQGSVIMWKETPLDAADRYHQDLQECMTGSRRVYSIADHDKLLKRAKTVIKILENAGGVRLANNTTKTHKYI